LRLIVNKIYKVADSSNRTFYVEVIDELCNWEYDYNTYKCVVLSKGDFYNHTLILVTEMWDVREASSLEIELL
jgi:hypothetical protein